MPTCNQENFRFRLVGSEYVHVYNRTKVMLLVNSSTPALFDPCCVIVIVAIFRNEKMSLRLVTANQNRATNCTIYVEKI